MSWPNSRSLLADIVATSSRPEKGKDGASLDSEVNRLLKEKGRKSGKCRGLGQEEGADSVKIEWASTVAVVVPSPHIRQEDEPPP